MLGEVQLRELDRHILERTYARLLASGGRSGRPLSTKTVQYCHGVLRRALEDAVLDGLLETNPARIARPPRRAPDDDEFDDDLQVWTGAQAVDVLAFVDDDPLQALWHLALGTGARRGELLGLRWVDGCGPRGRPDPHPPIAVGDRKCLSSARHRDLPVPDAQHRLVGGRGAPPAR